MPAQLMRTSVSYMGITFYVDTRRLAPPLTYGGLDK